MITALIMAVETIAAALVISVIAVAVIGARALIRQWRNARAVIRQTEAEFSEYADQAIKVVALWTTDEHEILSGRRPFQ